MTVRVTESARRQLRVAAQAVARRENTTTQGAFRAFIERMLAEYEAVMEERKPLSDFPDLPIVEAVRFGYRFFFRDVGDAVWLVGVWNARQSG